MGCWCIRLTGSCYLVRNCDYQWYKWAAASHAVLLRWLLPYKSPKTSCILFLMRTMMYCNIFYLLLYHDTCLFLYWTFTNSVCLSSNFFHAFLSLAYFIHFLLTSVISSIILFLGLSILFFIPRVQQKIFVRYHPFLLHYYVPCSSSFQFSSVSLFSWYRKFFYPFIATRRSSEMVQF